MAMLFANKVFLMQDIHSMILLTAQMCRARRRILEGHQGGCQVKRHGICKGC
ncbi:hypothetical protein PVAP13_6NG017900 [Panicum virgatum]|uniref:Uncharacterized protein n=1 Tax=Panicum virgatum TaxID=38727 RepID=A0A8T0QTN7_PANVG|nr:hypothetical protein PVAP13_6NG017900 [Panicum virgatum]